MIRQVQLAPPTVNLHSFVPLAPTQGSIFPKIGLRLPKTNGTFDCCSDQRSLRFSYLFRFLYMALICMDANFRLKNRLNSNLSVDPGLWNGMAYMALRDPYEKYVLSQADEEDVSYFFVSLCLTAVLTRNISQISTCVGFQALAKATTQNTRGLRYTGVGAAMCGRSEMVLPNSVANLQKGERYAFLSPWSLNTDTYQ